MNSTQLKKRKKIMQRSIALGHCICDPRKPCPCATFKEHNICECAGERLPIPSGAVRLTETVRNPGCASKIAKNDLRMVLKDLPGIDDSRVLIGSSAGDDAGVIMLNDETGTILTVDVFAPSVDDPYTFGQIAAANSVSDIYAMGGTPQAALSIIGFPIHTLPHEAMHEILRGGVEKMKEAGITVIGGHSINDEEVKCGFAVMGTAPKEKILANRGARIGDAVVLTKPLGVGIIAFGRQIGRASDAAEEEIADSMKTLNKLAGTRMADYSATAATDVTGYSLLGHMSEIIKNSRVAVELNFDKIPLFSQVKELACIDAFPGAVERNRESVNPALLDFTTLTAAQQSTLFCPETSGGLLVFLPENQAQKFVDMLQANGVESARIIGHVTEEHEQGRIHIKSTCAADWKTSVPPPALATVRLPSEIPEETDHACCSEEELAALLNEPLPSVAPEAPMPTSNKFLVDLSDEQKQAFKHYSSTINQPGALDNKAKKLISLALSIVTKCGSCVKINTRTAKEAGATDEEIREAIALGISFGGAPVNMFYNTLQKET